MCAVAAPASVKVAPHFPHLNVSELVPESAVGAVISGTDSAFGSELGFGPASGTGSAA